MNLDDYRVLPIECDRKCLVFSNGNSITFNEIELELKSRTKNLNIVVYGTYEPTDLRIPPLVRARFCTGDGYVKEISLEKHLFRDGKDKSSYYDYLVRYVATVLASSMFLRGEEWILI